MPPLTTDNESHAAGVVWDLEPLVDREGDAGLERLLDEAERRARALAAHRGRMASMDAAALALLMNEVAGISDLLGRAGSYAELRFAADTLDPANGARVARTEERLTAISNELIFIRLEWAALPDDRVAGLLPSPALDFCRHHLAVARRYRPHLLTEPEERILADKNVTGRNAWSRLFQENTAAITLTIDGEVVSLEEGLTQLHSPDRDVRRRAAEAVTAGLQPALRTRSFTFNTLLADKATDDRYRRYASWLQSRNLDNEAGDESVQALIHAVVGRYDIPQRWYELKAKMLGLPRLADYDRYALVAESEETYGWTRARAMVMDAYRSFSPELARGVEVFFDSPWIDAPVRPGKQTGAFCSYTVPSMNPYIMLNWTGRRSDVLTLAHELGHGVHAWLAKDQGIFHQTTPLTLAETASVFGETLTFGKLLQATTDPSARLALLAEDLEKMIATVFRQIAMNRFEDAVHTERRSKGELSVERFGEVWAETQGRMLGSAIEITAGYRTWWSYIPHFFQLPGYVYAYAYGQLFALSVYREYERRGPDFAPAYLEMLRRGGSMPPEELGRIVGVDVNDPKFWEGGLLLIEEGLRATEEAAAAAGRIPAATGRIPAATVEEGRDTSQAMTPSAALRTAALLLLVLGLARAGGGVVLAVSGAGAVDSARVDAETARALGGGLILVGLFAVVASVGVMRCRVWGWALAFLALTLFVADGLLNGYLLFGRPGDRGTMVNVAAALLILICLLRGRRALERVPRTAPSASIPP